MNDNKKYQEMEKDCKDSILIKQKIMIDYISTYMDSIEIFDSFNFMAKSNPIMKLRYAEMEMESIINSQ